VFAGFGEAGVQTAVRLLHFGRGKSMLSWGVRLNQNNPSKVAASTCARSRQGPCETECPYKGTTSEYWSARVGDGLVEADIAWAYDFPTRQLIPITGLVAFFNEKVDIFVDGASLERPQTHLA